MPFSWTRKADSPSVVTSFPARSRTLACTTTRRVSDVNTGTSSDEPASAEATCAGAGDPASGVAGCCAGFCASVMPTATSSRTPVLLSGCIISGTKHRFEWRQSGRLYQFHLNAPVLSIARHILGAIAEHVFVAQLDADLGGDVRKLGQVVHREMTSPCLFRDFRQQAGAVELLDRAAAPANGLEDTDCINLHIGFPHRILHFRFGV